ncbi:hypothetical protein LJC63_02050 [Ruminococcaceae bacterium OttesenSCG-928-L11]|nr:hypothetical protein [Ruminococcaceae bacterium OttesenSCG-928-L11]
MAQIEPFSCKHCGKKAEAFRHMRLRFSQMQYEHSYGRNYPKPSKTVDHGEVPVFLCDSCVRLYVREQYQERIFIGIKAAAYALIFLCIAFPIRNRIGTFHPSASNAR